MLPRGTIGAFVQELDAVHSLQDVQAAHTKFLEAAAQPCMASSEGSWQLIYTVLRKLLDICLCFHDIAPLLQVTYRSATPKKIPE